MTKFIHLGDEFSFRITSIVAVRLDYDSMTGHNVKIFIRGVTPVFVVPCINKETAKQYYEKVLYYLEED